MKREPKRRLDRFGLRLVKPHQGLEGHLVFIEGNLLRAAGGQDFRRPLGIIDADERATLVGFESEARRWNFLKARGIGVDVPAFADQDVDFEFRFGSTVGVRLDLAQLARNGDKLFLSGEGSRDLRRGFRF